MSAREHDETKTAGPSRVHKERMNTMTKTDTKTNQVPEDEVYTYDADFVREVTRNAEKRDTLIAKAIGKYYGAKLAGSTRRGCAESLRRVGLGTATSVIGEALKYTATKKGKATYAEIAKVIVDTREQKAQAAVKARAEKAKKLAKFEALDRSEQLPLEIDALQARIENLKTQLAEAETQLASLKAEQSELDKDKTATEKSATKKGKAE